MSDKHRYGIKGLMAPKWEVPTWIDGKGNHMTALDMDHFKGKLIFMLCFQSACPGCHSSGFPMMQTLVEQFKEKEEVVFLAVQTVFEDFAVNTVDRLAEVQAYYKLDIPFGHDSGRANGRAHSNIMYEYRTAGTPWVILINKSGVVIFNDFRIDATLASEKIEEALKEDINISGVNWVFPMEYPIKIFMENRLPGDVAKAYIMKTLQELEIAYQNWGFKMSSNNKYVSYSLDLTINSKEQLQEVYVEVSKIEHVIKVL